MKDINEEENEESFKKEIKVLRTRYFEGPNVHAMFPVVELIVDLGDLEDIPSEPYFAEELSSALPEIRDHSCSKGYEGGFLERLEEGTYPGHITEHIALSLQNLVGSDVSFGKCRQKDGSVYRIIFEYEHPSLASLVIEESVKIVEMLYSKNEGVKGYVEDVLSRAKKEFNKEKLGPSTESIIEAAGKRNIPYKRMNPEYSLFSLGWGKEKEMIWGPETSKTPLIGSELGKEKDISKDLLYDCGLPVPRGEVSYSLEEALDIADRIGYPVVLKPVDGHHGEGVMVNLRTPEDLKEAYEVTSEHSRYILIEKYIRGEDYRALLVDHEIAAVARRIPAKVVGDGSSTIKELVELSNRDPKRGKGHAYTLTELSLGKEEMMCLSNQGMTEEYIPSEGETIYLRSVANISTGGTAEDCTEDISDSLKRSLERASRIIGLDVTGIDIIADDITKPVDKMNWSIIEINSSPGLRMHISPTKGEPRAVGEKIVDNLFPSGNGRIPIIAITGTNGKTTTSRLTDWIAKYHGLHTGLAVTGGIWSGGDLIEKGDTTGPWSANVVLQDPEVDLAILETARGGLLKRGLGFDKSKVSVVTNIREDHLGIDGIKDVEDLFWVKSLVVETTAENGYCVLNADDHFAPRLMEKAKGTPILFAHERNELIDEWLDSNGTAFLQEDGKIAAYIDGEKKTLARTDELPYLSTGARMMVENALAAMAASYAAEIPLETIVGAFKSLEMNEELNPGRLNTYDIDGVKLIFDYAHNTDGLEALGEYVSRLSGKNRTLLYTGLGDRKDETIYKNGETAAEWFDNLIFSEKEDQLRGRDHGVIPILLNIGAGKHGKSGTIIMDRHDALRFALNKAESGDIVVCANLDFTSNDLDDYLSKTGKGTGPLATYMYDKLAPKKIGG